MSWEELRMMTLYLVVEAFTAQGQNPLRVGAIAAWKMAEALAATNQIEQVTWYVQHARDGEMSAFKNAFTSWARSGVVR
jgi:hypothetical protein